MRTLRLFVYCSALLAGTACLRARAEPGSLYRHDHRHSRLRTPRALPACSGSVKPSLPFLSQRLASPDIFPLTREDRHARLRPRRYSSRDSALPAPRLSVGRGHGRGLRHPRPLHLRRTAPLPRPRNRSTCSIASCCPKYAESGALVDLINVQSALAWDLLHAIRARRSRSTGRVSSTARPRCGWMLLKTTFEASPPGRNDQRRISSLREAVRLNPYV